MIYGCLVIQVPLVVLQGYALLEDRKHCLNTICKMLRLSIKYYRMLQRSHIRLLSFEQSPNLFTDMKWMRFMRIVGFFFRSQ